MTEIQIQDHERYICANCGLGVLARKRFGVWCHIATDMPPQCPSGVSRAQPMPDHTLRIWEEYDHLRDMEM